MSVDAILLVMGFAQHAVFSAALLALAVQSLRPSVWVGADDAGEGGQPFGRLVSNPTKPNASSWAAQTLVALGLAIGLAGAWWTRGWLGELSLTNTAWSCGALLWVCRVAGFRASPARRWFKVSARAAAVVALAGGVFYASALSLLPFDAYSLGYDAPLAAMAIVAAATLFWHGVRDWAWLIVAAAVVWALELGHSVNVWDAMLDAPFWVACCAIAIRATWRALKRLSGAARLKATGPSA